MKVYSLWDEEASSSNPHPHLLRLESSLDACIEYLKKYYPANRNTPGEYWWNMEQPIGFQEMKRVDSRWEETGEFIPYTRGDGVQVKNYAQFAIFEHDLNAEDNNEGSNS